MKKFNAVKKSFVAVVFALFLAGCSTPRNGAIYPTSTAASHFHDEAMVNAVLQFSSWDYTFLVRPQYTENGFLQPVRRDNIGQVFDRLNVQRGTAVVLVGWTYNGSDLDKVVAGWKSILGQCGFQRAVFLRAREGKRLNGSEVIDDSTLQVSSSQAPAQGG